MFLASLQARTAGTATAALVHLTSLTNDAVLVYFLAPVAGGDRGRKEPAAQRCADEEGGGGERWAHLQHCFQRAPGAPLSARAACFLRKARLYGAIGAASALVAKALVDVVMLGGAPLAGMGAAGLLEYQLRVALLGAINLGISSNTRYQLVNGVERVVYERAPLAAARAFSVVLRLCNNFVGARLFMLVAALFGM